MTRPAAGRRPALPPLLLLLLLPLLLGCGSPAAALRRLQQLYGWRGVDFRFPSPAARSQLIRSGAYVPGNAVPLDVDVHNNGSGQRVFVTLPRLRPGTPATLATVVEGGESEPGAPLLAPFPDWSWQRQGYCDGLTSVFRIQVDRCGRLWAVDTGHTDILVGFRRECPQQLAVFDLGSDRLVRRHRFPDGVVQLGSLPVTVAVDVRGDDAAACSAAFAYVADVTEYGLLVYDLEHDRSWRVTHKYFYPYPTSGTFNINGDTFDLMDGVLGLALSPVLRPENGERRLYFHSLASVRESWVSTAVLRNESLFEGGGNLASSSFSLSDGERPSQAAAEAMDSSGVLYFSPLERNSLNCWVAAGGGPYSERHFVELDRDDEALQFVSGMKVAAGRHGREEVWILTSRFQKLMVGSLNPADVNFRVLRAPVHTLVKGTKCEIRRTGTESRPGSVVFPGPTSRGGGRGPAGSSGVWRAFAAAANPRVSSATSPLSQSRAFSSLRVSMHENSPDRSSAWWLFTFHPPPPAAPFNSWRALRP